MSKRHPRQAAARAIERPEAQDAHPPTADAAEQLFAFQQNIAMAAISTDACAGSPDWNALAAARPTATGCMWRMLPVPWKQLSMLNGPAW